MGNGNGNGNGKTTPEDKAHPQRRGKFVPLKGLAAEAVPQCLAVVHVAGRDVLVVCKATT